VLCWFLSVSPPLSLSLSRASARARSRLLKTRCCKRSSRCSDPHNAALCLRNLIASTRQERADDDSDVEHRFDIIRHNSIDSFHRFVDAGPSRDTEREMHRLAHRFRAAQVPYRSFHRHSPIDLCFCTAVCSNRAVSLSLSLSLSFFASLSNSTADK